MNIRQALYQHLNDATIVDSYYGKIMVKGKQKTYYPVDFRLRKGHIDLPLKSDDIYFEYKTKTTDSNVCRGEFVFSKYYPIGSIITIQEFRLEITSYGEPTTIAGKTRVPIFTKCLNEDGTNIVEVLTNQTVEERVIQEVERILVANNVIKHSLPYYHHNWLDYTEDNVSAIDECFSLHKLLEIQAMQDREYDYKINDMGLALDPLALPEFKEEYGDFLKRYNYEKMPIKYNRGELFYNVISIAKWILFNRQFKMGRLYLRSIYNELSELEVYKGTNDSVVILVHTPDSALYDYRIELINVVRCHIARSYFEYIMDNIRVFALKKKGCCCSDEEELVNLTGDSEKISRNIIRLKPYSGKCPYSPWSCLNNCPPWNCSDPKPYNCINDCNKDTNGCGDDDCYHSYNSCNGNCSSCNHHKHDCCDINYDTECDNDRCSCNNTIDISKADFVATFFNIFCDLLRLICASKDKTNESGASCRDEYYGILNTEIVNMINKYRADAKEEETYTNTAKDFYDRYCDTINKTVESVVTEDYDKVLEALDEYDKLPSDEQPKALEYKNKLDLLMEAILMLGNKPDTPVIPVDPPKTDSDDDKTEEGDGTENNNGDEPGNSPENPDENKSEETTGTK